MKKDQLTLSKSQLLSELSNERKYHHEGSYRQKTAEFAIEVASSVPDPLVFVDRPKTLQIAAAILTETDSDRIKDVAKMVNVIVMNLLRRSNENEEMKAYVKQKKQQLNKPLAIIKKYK